MNRCIDWNRCLREKKGMIVGCSEQGKVKCPFDPKPIKKPKTRKIKAWAWVTTTGKIIVHDRCFSGDIPCTITINTKYLKGDK